MKIIRNKFIPFKGFCAINLFGILFVRKDCTVGHYTINHEQIHTAQMREMLYLPFYVWYLVEYLIRLLLCFNTKEAYRSISFEREAYGNQYNDDYLTYRDSFSWFKFLNKK